MEECHCCLCVCVYSMSESAVCESERNKKVCHVPVQVLQAKQEKKDLENDARLDKPRSNLANCHPSWPGRHPRILTARMRQSQA